MILFDLPILFLLVFLTFCLSFFLRVRKKSPPPFLHYSALTQLELKETGLRARYSKLPRVLYVVVALLFAFALLDFRVMEEVASAAKTTSGRALFLVLDESGSMKDLLVMEERRGEAKFMSKLEYLKTVSKNLVEMRPHDFLGVVAFARSPQVLTPLTLDHTRLLEELAKLQGVQNQEEDGTAIGYAIYKTAHLIASARLDLEKEKSGPQIKDAAIILVTDGFQSPHPGDRGNSLRTIGIEEAADFAKNSGIHLYIVNIEPLIEEDEYTPQRNLMERAAAKTGGKFFTVTEPNKLQPAFSAIDKLEKSELPRGGEYFLIRKFSFFSFLTAVALLILALAILLETTYLRRWP